MKKERKCGTREKKGLYIYNVENDITPIQLMIISCILNTCKKNSKLNSKDNKSVCDLTNKQIANLLYIDERTVKTALNNLIEDNLVLINNDEQNDNDGPITLRIEVDDDLSIIEEPKNEQRLLTVSNNIKVKRSGFMIPINILKSKKLSICEKLVFSYLNSFDNQNKECIAKTKTIQQICKIKSRTTIKTLLNKFKSKDLISTEIYENNRRIIKTNKINMVNYIAEINNIEQVDVIAEINNIEQVNNINTIENVQIVNINSFDLSKIDLSTANRDELLKGYKSAKNLVELYKLALNSKVDTE